MRATGSWCGCDLGHGYLHLIGLGVPRRSGSVRWRRRRSLRVLARAFAHAPFAAANLLVRFRTGVARAVLHALALGEAALWSVPGAVALS